MATVVTAGDGPAAKPVGLLYTEPERAVVDAGSDTALSRSGLDAGFVADVFSACSEREILASQIDLATDRLDYVTDADLPDDHRCRQYRERINAGGVPSEQVIELNRQANGEEFRDETEGEHPVPELRV